MSKKAIQVLLFAALLSPACDDVKRGAEGESCTSRNDCEEGLQCIALTCVPRGSSGGGDASVAAPSPAEQGEPCTSRRDCAVGLACIANRCTEQSAGMEPGGRYSGRGESCAASNECASDLACVSNMCAAVTVGLEHTPKSCDRIECAADADCCAAFVPNPSCEQYRQNCETDPVFCNTYRSLCQCSQRCVDELCTTAAPGCTDSAECTSLQTPFCVEGTCVQCEADANCPGMGGKCVQGVCMSACTSDEQCPLLHACEDGACVDVGCRSDRECVFVSGDASSVCRDGKCQDPCDSDSDCAAEQQRFSVCVDSQCVFVGCESDAECRALLHLENQPSSKVRAVCRERASD